MLAKALFPERLAALEVNQVTVAVNLLQGVKDGRADLSEPLDVRGAIGKVFHMEVNIHITFLHNACVSRERIDYNVLGINVFRLSHKEVSLYRKG